MKIQILYQTQYLYGEQVSFSLHLFRLFPKVDRYVRVLDFDFQTNTDGVINYRRDLFDNEIASCFYPTKSSLLSAMLQMQIEVREKNAFGFLLESRALDLPFTYNAAEERVLAPYFRSRSPVPLPFWTFPTTPRPTIETLVELNQAIHDSLEYERRDEGEAMTPEETVTLGKGACRDFAVLFAETARALGLAARLASGYLCEFGDTEKRAEGALHAWAEVYLPGGGWIGFDPTNGTLCNHHHLTAAVGITAADVAPVLGNYYHPSKVASQMNTSLQIIPQ